MGSAPKRWDVGKILRNRSVALKGKVVKAQGAALGHRGTQNYSDAVKGHNQFGSTGMSQSLSNALLHLVFSTKNRHPWVELQIEGELFKYIGGICREPKCASHKIGGADDHIHIACSLSRTVAISK